MSSVAILTSVQCTCIVQSCAELLVCHNLGFISLLVAVESCYSRPAYKLHSSCVTMNLKFCMGHKRVLVYSWNAGVPRLGELNFREHTQIYVLMGLISAFVMSIIHRMP